MRTGETAPRARGAFHSNESGNTEQEEDENRIRKVVSTVRTAAGENTGKGEHREKQRIPVRDRAIEADDLTKNQKMPAARSAANSGGLDEFSNRKTREKQGIHGEDAK